MTLNTACNLDALSLDDLFDRIEYAIAANPSEHVRKRIAKLQRIVDTSLALDARDSSQAHIELAERAMGIMSANTETPLTIVQIASSCGVSPTLLKQTFKSVVGVPVYQWYRSHRVARARALLSDTSLSIAQIALAVGYSNPSKFAKAFKDETGTTPFKWRNEHKTEQADNAL